jgi:hypothetical protein
VPTLPETKQQHGLFCQAQHMYLYITAAQYMYIYITAAQYMYLYITAALFQDVEVRYFAERLFL